MVIFDINLVGVVVWEYVYIGVWGVYFGVDIGGVFGMVDGILLVFWV